MTLRRTLAIASLLAAPFAPATLQAQTYTPKEIRIDAPPGTDTAETLRIAAIPEHVPITKQQIEEGLGRLADSGLFSDLSYKVGPSALIIKLTPTKSSQTLPVRYGNLVWWQPGELEPLVEARVPLFHGSLPAAGTLTEQVEAAIVALLKDKGIDAKVEAALVSGRNGSVGATNLTVTRPEVVVADLTLQNMLPALKPSLTRFADSQRGQDFDIGETYDSIRLTVADIYQNGGYLDAATTTPTYSAPQKDLDRYAVNVTSAITAGDIYRIARIGLVAPPPVSQADAMRVAELKVGGPASPLALRIAQGELALAYSQRGYLDAKASVQTAKDSAAHTVAYDIDIAPGEVYRFASIDTTAFTPEQQATFARAFHAAPGVIADQDLQNAIGHAAAGLHLVKQPNMSVSLDRTAHTAAYTVKPATH